MRAVLDIHDPTSRQSLESFLAYRGWEVRHAAGNPEFPVGEPSLLVVQETPAGTGSALCRAIRQTGPGRSVYMIGVVWQHDMAAIRRLAAAGVDDIMTAPFDADEVENRLTLAEARLGSPQPGVSVLVGGSQGGELSEITRKLHVQQAFLEALFESAPEGVVILDEARRVARINGEFTRVFGYTPDEAHGRRLSDLIVPREMRREAIEIGDGIDHGERVLIETVRRHRDGQLIDVSVLATPIDVNGPAGAFAIYRDITERKRQEAALRESEARYRTLFDQSPVGFFLCDRDLRITHCNEYLCNLLEASESEIVGAELANARGGRLRPHLRAASRGEPAFYEGPYRSRDGGQLYVSIQYVPLRDDDTGEVTGGIGAIADISHRVLGEKKLRAQAAEMERVNAALRERTLELEEAMSARSRLYSSMNHELRTPISAILLYQELLVAESLGPLNEEQVKALEHSYRATRHLLDLVRDILDLGKIEAGKVKVQPVEVRLETLLGDLHASMAPLAESYGSPLYLEMTAELEPVITDPQRLRQILMNFVSNAAKFGRRNPIRMRSWRRDDGETVIEVIDRGIGIPPEDVDRVFDEFVQLGQGSESEEGTGLGLAISRRLADLLGARLEVESTVGAGSCFRVVLPPEPAAMPTFAMIE